MDEAAAPSTPPDALSPYVPGPAAGAPSPRRRQRRGRRKRAILTVGLVLYTLALAVAVLDDIFRIGLFPTEQERRARRLIERFDDPDETVRRQAAEELTRCGDDRFVAKLMHAAAARRTVPRHRGVDVWVAVPELIRALHSASPRRRALAVECLRRLTRARNGYEPDAPPAERRAAAARWRRWWAANKGHF